MATVLTVHGTFAQSATGATDASAAGDRTWWQAGGVLDDELRASVAAEGGAVDVRPFTWSGANSERERREAGHRLYKELLALEGTGQPYIVVGHSHGGSVIDWALLESAAHKKPLPGLKRWITIGTPFVNLKREPLLIQRLDLMAKVVLVASLMLLVMLLVYLAAEMLDGGPMLIGSTFPAVLAVTALLMSLPAVVFYLVLKLRDSRSHYHYRRGVRDRARFYFSERWRSLTHANDEAVQGLAFLPEARLAFFDRGFAVQTLTMLSVIALPLLYLVLLQSPTIMVGIGDWLKSNVYDTRPNPEAEKALRDLYGRIRDTRASRNLREAPPAERQAFRQKLREDRRALEARFPGIEEAERGLRFKSRFFETNGKPCEGGKLCGGGRDIKVNSALLLHLVTDELSAAIGADDFDDPRRRWISSLLVPAILVPVIFGLFGLALMLVIRWLASVISGALARVLNMMTNAEVKRAAFGNDTEGEIATGAIDRPTWIAKSPVRLPGALADTITAYSNGIASQSLAKFRSVIGQLASLEAHHGANAAVTTYFTWKELVHSSYFDVPEFRKLVAQAISRAEGFRASPAFEADRDYALTAQWLAEIEGAPGTPATPAAKAPTSEDAGAVAATVASTVKVEP